MPKGVYTAFMNNTHADYLAALQQTSTCRIALISDETTCYGEVGMLFRITHVGPPDQDGVFKVTFDFGPFHAHNDRLATDDGRRFANGGKGTEESYTYDNNVDFRFEAADSEPLEAKLARYESALRAIANMPTSGLAEAISPTAVMDAQALLASEALGVPGDNG